MTDEPVKPKDDILPPPHVGRINITNDFCLSGGYTIPPSGLIKDREPYIRPLMVNPQFRTKQQVYRFVAWLTTMAEVMRLPDEEVPSTMEEILQAVRNS